MGTIKKNKTVIALAIIVAMIMGFTLSNINKLHIVNASTNSRSYFKYEASDGGYFGFYTLPQTNNLSRSIINLPDDRVNDKVYNGVVKLIGSTNYLGTGFIVNNHVIATAAHCVYNSDYTSKVVEDILVFNSNNSVSAHLTPVEIHIPCEYLTCRSNNDLQEAKKYDYALITVAQSLPATTYTHFNLSTCFDNVSLASNSLKVTGFPQSVNNNLVNTKTSHSQYTGTGNLQDLTDYKLFYDTDTSGGNSGGPVYIEETINNNKCYTVLAIHTHGEDGNDNDNSENNCGTRITTDIMKFYMSNSNIGY